MGYKRSVPAALRLVFTLYGVVVQMKYIFCQTSSDDGQTGDCLRACVASVLGLEAEEVPHFFHDKCTAEIGAERLKDFARGRGLVPCYIIYPGSVPMEQVLEYWGGMNPDVPAILYGSTQDEEHCVVILDGEVKHNPAWSNSPLVGPTSENLWYVLVFVKQ